MTVLVAGGGPAGAAAATLLARAGRRVVLIERAPVPAQKLCGEFLSVEALGYLRALGLDVAGLGAAPIGQVAVMAGRTRAASRLPFQGAALGRPALDGALLAMAATSGAEVRRGVRILRAETDGSALVTESGRLAASCVLLATGKTELRGLPRSTGRAPEDQIGFKQVFALAPGQAASLADRVEIVLFAGGYAGLQAIGGGVASFCLLASTARLAASGGTFGALMEALRRECPTLDARLAGATAMLPRPLAISRVPYGFLHRAAPADPPGLFRLGDQAAVIPSFSGDGIAIALHTGFAAAAAVLRGEPAAAYHARLAAELAPQFRRARVLRDLARSRAGRAAIVRIGAGAPSLLRRAATATRLRFPLH